MKIIYKLIDRLKIFSNLSVDYRLDDININDVNYVTYQDFNENKKEYTKFNYVDKINSEIVALVPFENLPCRLLSKVAQSHFRKFRDIYLLVFIEELKNEKLKIYFTSNYEVFNSDLYTSITIDKDLDDEDKQKLKIVFSGYLLDYNKAHVICDKNVSFDFLNDFKGDMEIERLSDKNASSLMVRTNIYVQQKQKIISIMLFLLAISIPSYFLNSYGEDSIKEKKEKLNSLERKEKIKNSKLQFKINKLNDEIEVINKKLANFRGIHYDN